MVVDFGLVLLVQSPTHGNNVLVLAFESRFDLYTPCVIKSILKTKNKAILAVPPEYKHTYAKTYNREKIMVYDLKLHNIDKLRYYLRNYDWSGIYNCTNLTLTYGLFWKLFHFALI